MLFLIVIVASEAPIRSTIVLPGYCGKSSTHTNQKV